MSNLRQRLARLEQRLVGQADRPALIFIHVPDGKPDAVTWWSGRHTVVPDGRFVAAHYRGQVKVLVGIDPEWV